MSETLPPGWHRARVEDLAEAVDYGSSTKTSEDATGVPVLRMGNIFDGRLVFRGLKYLPSDHSEFPNLLLEPGDVLFNRTNSPELVGKTAVYGSDHPSPCSFASYLIRVRFRGYEPALFSAYVKSSYGREWVRSCVSQQVGQANVSGGKLKALEVPVPPLNEQRRIVAKLEALQARSRRAREALEAVPPLLEKLRQSILAAAFRGDLTKDWRAKHPEVEPASELLKRIRVERRRKWEEAELGKMRAKGKVPGDDRWKGKYQEALAVNAVELPILPDGWCWATVEELTSHVVDCLHRTPVYLDDGLPAIRTSDIIPGRLLLSQARRVSSATFAEQAARLLPKAGDVFYSREGTFGLAALVPAGVEVCISQRMMHFRTVAEVSPGFFMWGLNSPIGYEQAQADVTGSTSPHVNIASIRGFHLPLAPVAEQVAIAGAVGAAWTRVDGFARAMETTNTLLTTFEAAALAKAFRGELVAADPNREPADAVHAALNIATNVASMSQPNTASARSRKAGVRP